MLLFEGSGTLGSRSDLPYCSAKSGVQLLERRQKGWALNLQRDLGAMKQEVDRLQKHDAPYRGSVSSHIDQSGGVPISEDKIVGSALSLADSFKDALQAAESHWDEKFALMDLRIHGLYQEFASNLHFSNRLPSESSLSAVESRCAVLERDLKFAQQHISELRFQNEKRTSQTTCPPVLNSGTLGAQVTQMVADAARLAVVDAVGSLQGALKAVEQRVRDQLIEMEARFATLENDFSQHQRKFVARQIHAPLEFEPRFEPQITSAFEARCEEQLQCVTDPIDKIGSEVKSTSQAVSRIDVFESSMARLECFRDDPNKSVHKTQNSLHQLIVSVQCDIDLLRQEFVDLRHVLNERGDALDWRIDASHADLYAAQVSLEKCLQKTNGCVRALAIQTNVQQHLEHVDPIILRSFQGKLRELHHERQAPIQYDLVDNDMVEDLPFDTPTSLDRSSVKASNAFSSRCRSSMPSLCAAALRAAAAAAAPVEVDEGFSKTRDSHRSALDKVEAEQSKSEEDVATSEVTSAGVHIVKHENNQAFTNTIEK